MARFVPLLLFLLLSLFHTAFAHRHHLFATTSTASATAHQLGSTPCNTRFAGSQLNAKLKAGRNFRSEWSALKTCCQKEKASGTACSTLPAFWDSAASAYVIANQTVYSDDKAFAATFTEKCKPKGCVWKCKPPPARKPTPCSTFFSKCAGDWEPDQAKAATPCAESKLECRAACVPALCCKKKAKAPLPPCQVFITRIQDLKKKENYTSAAEAPRPQRWSDQGAGFLLTLKKMHGEMDECCAKRVGNTTHPMALDTKQWSHWTRDEPPKCAKKRCFKYNPIIRQKKEVPCAPAAAAAATATASLRSEQASSAPNAVNPKEAEDEQDRAGEPGGAAAARVL